MPKATLNKSAPCAAESLRDEAQGAKSGSGSLPAPGFGTRRIARKGPPPKGFGPKRAICAPSRLRVPSGTRRATLARNSLRFGLERAWRGLVQRCPKLPHLSGAEIQRALEKLGFQQVRQSGSHVVLKREANGCVVPLHSEVKIGTLAGLLRQAEVSPEEFMLALRK